MQPVLHRLLNHESMPCWVVVIIAAQVSSPPGPLVGGASRLAWEITRIVAIQKLYLVCPEPFGSHIEVMRLLVKSLKIESKKKHLVSLEAVVARTNVH